MDVIKELGLESVVYNYWNELRGDFDKAILLKDLRAAIEKLPVVYGSEALNGHLTWNPEKQTFSTHKARLICVEKLAKEPVRVEFEATVTEINSLAVNLGNFYIFHDSMKELAGRKVKVVATEVIE